MRGSITKFKQARSGSGNRGYYYSLAGRNQFPNSYSGRNGCHASASGRQPGKCVSRSNDAIASMSPGRRYQ